jgi:RimJ/RimL family protein N-acetyltransferase
MAEDIENIDPLMIEFKCPYCGGLMSFPDMDAGLPQECPSCMEILIVPRGSCDIGGRFPLPIITPRLNLRRVQPEDEAGYVGLSADDELSWSVPDEEQIYGWIQSEQKERPSLQDRGLRLTIEIQERSKFIGSAVIQNFNGVNDQGQIQRLVICRDEQRKGYGLEALNGLLAFGFSGIGMRRIVLSGNSEDATFMGFAAKAGFRQEGEFIKEWFVQGKWLNRAFFAMLKDEFGNNGVS